MLSHSTEPKQPAIMRSSEKTSNAHQCVVFQAGHLIDEDYSAHHQLGYFQHLVSLSSRSQGKPIHQFLLSMVIWVVSHSPDYTLPFLSFVTVQGALSQAPDSLIQAPQHTPQVPVPQLLPGTSCITSTGMMLSLVKLPISPGKYPSRQHAPCQADLISLSVSPGPFCFYSCISHYSLWHQ